jgi:hypothetical protein
MAPKQSLSFSSPTLVPRYNIANFPFHGRLPSASPVHVATYALSGTSACDLDERGIAHQFDLAFIALSACGLGPLASDDYNTALEKTVQSIMKQIYDCSLFLRSYGAQVFVGFPPHNALLPTVSLDSAMQFSGFHQIESWLPSRELENCLLDEGRCGSARDQH